jgi:hypothetical protein
VDGVESLHIPEFADDYRYMTNDESDKALRELLTGAMNDKDTEIDMDEAVVEGFDASFRLLPHQVLGRKWMREREDPEKKRFGGILADDMVSKRVVLYAKLA